MDILEVNHVSFSYVNHENKAIDDINFSIKKGEFVIVCGESGSGKSTLLKLLKRELRPHGVVSGKIFLKGQDVLEIDDYVSAANIGYVMQNPENQIVTEKVWSELSFGLENLGISSQEIRSRVGETANFFGIHSWFHKKTAELSGGQKQILNLAFILVMQPEILILDEPTSQLDPIAAAEFIRTLHRLNQEMNITIIIVEHRLEELYSIADRILIMEDGRLLLNGKPKEVGGNLNNLRKKEAIIQSFPTAVRVFNQLDSEEKCPINIKEGRIFLENNYQSIHYENEYSNVLSNQEKVIELKDVSFRYSKNSSDVIESCSLTIYQNEIFCLLGGNGSGKSTLLNIMGGIYIPYEGKVKINGIKFSKRTQKKLWGKGVAILPQDPLSMFVEETVLEEYIVFCRKSGYEKEVSENKIQNVVDKLQIGRLMNQHPYDLSGGEQQKIAIGKLLLLDSKVILLDEPTKGIDANAKQEVGMILKELSQEGKTIVVVTHDTDFAASFATRCGLFFDRQAISINNPVDFFSTNHFYTTAANKMARNIFPKAITADDIILSCKNQRG